MTTTELTLLLLILAQFAFNIIMFLWLLDRIRFIEDALIDHGETVIAWRTRAINLEHTYKEHLKEMRDA